MSAQPYRFWLAAFYAGIVAGITSTIAQILLWWMFWDALPMILYRDARFAAAIIIGHQVLPPPVTLDWQIMFIATCIHFVLSIIYAVILFLLLRYLNIKALLTTGSLYGIGLFTINMYGFSIIYPWFAETRDWITLAAHIVFGVSVAGVYKFIAER